MKRSVRPHPEVVQLKNLRIAMILPRPVVQSSPAEAINFDINRERYASWDMPPAQGGESYRLLSLFVPANEIGEKALLQSYFGRERFYWSEPVNKEGRKTIVGVGIAAELRVAPNLDIEDFDSQLPGHRFQAIDQQATRLFQNALIVSIDGVTTPQNAGEYSSHPARPRFIGGFAFQDDFVPDNTWSVFNPAHFVLPHYQLVRCGGDAFLTINALVPLDESLNESIFGLREALSARMAMLTSPASRKIVAVEINYPMNPVKWQGMVGHAIDEIESGHLDKVVLSRVCEVVTHDPIDAAETFDYLNSQYGDCYRFIFEPVPYHAFFGATPELLVEKAGNAIETMALAGSAARGATPEEDDENGRALLASSKDIHEHRLVVDAIRNQLDDSLAEISQPSEPEILRLRNIQHLLTPITGQLKNPDEGILPLVRLLHPTPAMGGIPVEHALAFLRHAEPVPRGWYAAPIGWFDVNNDGVFAVAIRSAVTQYNRAWLYAGAGIVGDSQPDQEWTETGLKFRPMLGALGIKEHL